MNEQYNAHEQNMSLPQPVEAGQKSQKFETDHAKTVEAGATGVPSPSQAPPAYNQSMPQTPSQTQPNSAAAPNDNSSPHIADDLDLIEKEWVERAKRIVEQTRNDPYRQSEELHITKDDYQGKRFNRDTNLSDAA